MARTEAQHIRDWLKALGSLTAFSGSASEFSAKISAYTPLLQGDFSQAAFSPGSLAAIARKCEFFPTYAKLSEHLASWWRDHRPPPSAHLLANPKDKTHAEWQQEAEQSWRDISAGQVRARITEIQMVGGGAEAHPARSSFGRMFAHAIANHAPHHLALIPPEWLKPEVPRR
jgi:hypothetical protein